MSLVIPIILAGGSGSRLWPLSREHYPKQLLTLTGKYSLLQQTIKRAQQLSSNGEPLVICNKHHRFLVAEQMLEIGVNEPKLILEPVGRNTAPAIGIAAGIANKLYPEAEPLLLILPADHVIQEIDIFLHCIEMIIPFVTRGYLCTFGVQPTCPETGYGYIKRGQMLSPEVFTIDQFVEKPNYERAEAFIKSQEYYWNSGMFFCKSTAYLEELERYQPEIYTYCQQEVENLKNIGGFYSLSETFNACPSNSIDYAVMEHTNKALVIPMPVTWSDVGSWSALWNLIPKDNNNNIIQGDVTAIDIQDCYIRSESRLVAIAGLKEHIVVETPDAVMIAHKNYAQNVKDLFNDLKNKARNEIKQHRRVHRPWGTYELLAEGPYYRVKHVLIKPRASLSAQMHQHRSEHWVILRGTASITLGEKKILLNPYESTFIPVNQLHQLSNPSSDLLEIIEIQAGNYLSEEDIYH